MNIAGEGYATKQLTKALQELVANSCPPKDRQQPPQTIETMHYYPEVESFLKQKREYTEKTHSVNVGTY